MSTARERVEEILGQYTTGHYKTLDSIFGQPDSHKELKQVCQALLVALDAFDAITAKRDSFDTAIVDLYYIDSQRKKINQIIFEGK